jgi:hypothetical protein
MSSVIYNSRNMRPYYVFMHRMTQYQFMKEARLPAALKSAGAEFSFRPRTSAI